MLRKYHQQVCGQSSWEGKAAGQTSSCSYSSWKTELNVRVNVTRETANPPYRHPYCVKNNNCSSLYVFKVLPVHSEHISKLLHSLLQCLISKLKPACGWKNINFWSSAWYRRRSIVGNNKKHSTISAIELLCLDCSGAARRRQWMQTSAVKRSLCINIFNIFSKVPHNFKIPTMFNKIFVRQSNFVLFYFELLGIFYDTYAVFISRTLLKCSGST